ncbi:MAG TPA: MarR family transcriptional regulator [Clostridiales bacterium]|nr:MarR family transcriptional regulator [Clostridiales bacterium]
MDTFFDPDSLDALLIKIIRLHYIRSHRLFSEIGLSKGQPPILFVLWEDDGCTQREISQRLKLRPATITSVLKRMERDGLIDRRTDEKDLRMLRVFLTPKGKKLKSEVQRVIKTLKEECFQGLTVEEKLQLSKIFIKIKNNLLSKIDDNEWY